jgi:hypothetical protein
MAMMTAASAPSGKRHGRAQRLGAQAPGASKNAGGPESGGRLDIGGDQVECGGREDATCLARHAGPGPRI